MDNEIKMICENLNIVQLSTFFDGFCLTKDLQGVNQKSPDPFPAKSVFSAVNNTAEVNVDLLNENLSTLKYINISCGLTKIPNVIFNCKYLFELNLSKNSLEILPKEIGNLCNLVILNLSFNKLKCLPKSIKHIHQLSYLNLSNNKFCDVPDILYFGLKSLKVLDLSYNEISVFDDAPRCLDSLVALGMSNNLLKKLPFWVFDGLCQLQFLCVNGNELCLDFEPTNCCTFGIFDSLQFINVENCNLRHKDLQILAHFKNLNVLLVGNKKLLCKNIKTNYLGDFKVKICKNFSKIRCLYMQNAHIPSLPSDFDCLKNIEILDLSENFLTWLPESFCNLLNLKILNLSSNQLLFLPENIGNLTCLQQIHLGNNKLYKICESFYNLSNLEFIDLYCNKLDKIQVNIFQKKNLKGIDLGLNFLHFEICDCCHNDSEIRQGYNLLKESFRRHFKCKDNRSDFQGANLVTENSSCSQSIVGSFESESFSETEDALLSTALDSTFLDEDWEENESNKIEEDELFDPNEITKFKKPENIWNLNFRNNYCPAKYHTPSVLRRHGRSSNQTSNNETVEDGQFDSD